MPTRCTRCIMVVTRPDTEFVDGICSACIAHDRRPEIDWGKREQDLLRILESVQPVHGYHCVVPSSGGKDSHWQVLKLIELGARPLVVTATTCMLTPIGARNIRNLARYATTVEITPNLRVRALLNRLGLELVGDISFAEHVSIFSTPWRVAKQHGLNLMFYGESPTVSYGGPMDSLGISQMTRRWITEFGGHLKLRPSDLVDVEGLTAADMADYEMPSEEAMGQMQAHFLGHFYPWDSHRNASVAIEHGMEAELPSPANWWIPENLDCFLTGCHDFFAWLKYSLGRATAQLSVDVRNGLISREDALRIAQERDGIFPAIYMGGSLEMVLEHIGITPDCFMKMCNQYMNTSLFVENRVEWGQKLTLRS